MTAAVKHMARNKPGTAGTPGPAQPRNSQLRQRFPARPAQSWWPETAQGEEETLRRLTSPPFLPEVRATRAGRRRGTAKLLRWLSSFPGDTWQQRWEASGAEDAPATIRAFGMAQGQLTIGELVDRYRLQCKPVRDLLVDYLRERQPSLDYASLDAISSSLAGLFWARIEALSPGISTLRLPPEVARAWKEDLLTVKRSVTGPDCQRTGLRAEPGTGNRAEVPACRLVTQCYSWEPVP